MILSKKFVNDYTPLKDITLDDLANRMLKLGNEYESYNKLVNASSLIIGEVTSCENIKEISNK